MSSSINPISLASVNAIVPANPGSLTKATDGGDAFKKMFDGAIGSVTGTQQVADNEIQKLLSGQSQDIHSAMIATQQADLSFQMFMGVRNKLTSAYQSIMGMQL